MLMRFQPVGAKTAKPGIWMILSPEFAVAIAQIAVDATASDRVAGVVGVGQGEAFERPEGGLDQVQPA
jgi:hypothetical protein